jgi:hypothetical protein
MRHALPCAVLLLAGCPAPAEDTHDSHPEDTGTLIPLEPAFTFAVLADPHLYGSADHEARAVAAVEWLNANADSMDIELLLIVGDIAWNEGIEGAPALFGQLSFPWVPVTGDNEIQSDDEQAFFEAFEPHWQALAGQLEGFTYAAMPVDNPEHERQSWFTNNVFTHRGVTFVGLDWCTRHQGGVFGEMADLHQFEDGTYTWLEATLTSLDEPARESVVMFSHHPMHLSPGAFDLEEMEALEGLVEPYGDLVYANFGGHYHADGESSPDSGLYEVHVTDATWDDDNTLRLVHVSGNGARFAYEQELVVVE